MAGMGDLLALFRCISCRFNFGANPQKPESLGAPGRVFISGHPELACNVQQYPREAYLRRAEAEQCRVQSSMLLPVFVVPSSTEPRPSAVGVVEIVQTSDDMAFLPMARLLGAVLLKCGLHTSTIVEVQGKLPTAVTSLPLPLRTGLLEPVESTGIGEAESADDPGGGGDAGHQNRGGGSGDTSMRHLEDDGYPEDYGDEDGGSDGQDGSGGQLSDDAGKSTRGRGRRRRPGKSGKPGVKLTLADLRGQFGVGLKEAASTLGVCTTTLKRACRRHGIQRWPRRALQRVSRTLDEMERHGSLQNVMTGAIPMGPLIHPGSGQLMMTPPPMPQSIQQMPVDSRWATLANMIPNMHGAFSLPTPDQITGGSWLGTNEFAPTQPQTQPPAQQQPKQGPAASDFSLEGAVVISNRAKEAGNVTVATGLTQWEAQHGTAAGTLAAMANAAAAQHASQRIAATQQQQQSPRIAPAAPQVNVVPSFLRPDLGDAQRQSFESPFASDGQSPGDNNDNTGTAGRLPIPSLGPGFSYSNLPNLSQMSVPSFNPFLVPSSFMHLTGGSGLVGTGGPSPRALPPASVGNGGHATSAVPVGAATNQHRQGGVDDVGLLDSTILELMLSEDSRGLVGATDDDLRRLFQSAAAAGQHAAEVRGHQMQK